MHSDVFLQELHNVWPQWRQWLKTRASELGFEDLRITDTDVHEAHPRLLEWLENGHHGQMQFMERNRDLRANPSTLQLGALRSICLTMPYLSSPQASTNEPQMPGASVNPQVEKLLNDEEQRLSQSTQAIVSVYARGRDYHKVIRSRLQVLASELDSKFHPLLQRINSADSRCDVQFQYRVVTDSAPLMEVELARKAGLGWRGKHTLLLNRHSGSFFFLGEILINLPLPIDEPVESHCGSCQACMDVCPTQAIIAPYQLDARRCISYLTIEHASAIPLEFRSAMGNRIYGCDDCQLVCPWNKYAKISSIADFVHRHGLGNSTLLELWRWSDAEFNKRHQGSAIRRIGYERWRRNLAVALGNALASNLDLEQDQSIRQALQAALVKSSPLVVEHIRWALFQGPKANS